MLLPQSENNAGYFKKETPKLIYNRIAHKICQGPSGASFWTPRLGEAVGGRTAGRTGGLTEGRMEGRASGQRVGGAVPACVRRWTAGRTGGLMEGRMGGRAGRWADSGRGSPSLRAWTDSREDGWVCGAHREVQRVCGVCGAHREAWPGPVSGLSHRVLLRKMGRTLPALLLSRMLAGCKEPRAGMSPALRKSCSAAITANSGASGITRAENTEPTGDQPRPRSAARRLSRIPQP